MNIEQHSLLFNTLGCNHCIPRMWSLSVLIQPLPGTHCHQEEGLEKGRMRRVVFIHPRNTPPTPTAIQHDLRSTWESMALLHWLRLERTSVGRTQLCNCLRNLLEEVGMAPLRTAWHMEWNFRGSGWLPWVPVTGTYRVKDACHYLSLWTGGGIVVRTQMSESRHIGPYTLKSWW